ncbi:CHRNN [Mytilus coruscus]|uniref:CHRNN n=1 Tax=Mytilus coruscus TaxID=42192 RepID=A0A6J8F518_MYTCO|nr:CHRNN [Mytilus coruscus]
MFFVILFIFSLLPIFGRSYNFSDEQNLRSILLNDNVTRALPTVNSSEPIHTRVQLYLHSVYNLDITKQKLSSSVLILNTWKDESLKWNITLYNGISRLMFPLSLIWKPDIVLLNSMETKIIFHSNDEVLLDSKGIVTWSAYLNLVTYCHVNTTLYPFDRQTCDLVFSKQYLSDRYHYLCHNDSNNITESYVSNGEWDIRDIQRLNNTKYSLLGTFTDIIFRVVLERKTDYYYWTYVVPMISLAVVDVGTFCLPVKSYEKLNICLFVFLSMVYLVTVVNDSMPHTSDDISKFGTLLWCFILLSGLIIVTNILIITMVHRKCPKFLPPVVAKFKRRINSCCKVCVNLRKRGSTFICSRISQLTNIIRAQSNLNKENEDIIEMTDTNLQDESTEASPFISPVGGIELQQIGKITEPQDLENESSKDTDDKTDNMTSSGFQQNTNDNSGTPFPTKLTDANLLEENTSTVVIIHEEADADIDGDQNASNGTNMIDVSTKDDKTDNETSPGFQQDTNDNSGTPNINQSTDANILVDKICTEAQMLAEADAKIKGDQNASYNTNTIDVITKGEDVEKDKNDSLHKKQQEENNAHREKECNIENNENNVGINYLNEGQKDNINMVKDSVDNEEEEQSESHVLKPEDIQLSEKSDEKDDEKDVGSLQNLRGLDKNHGTSLPNDSERKIDKNEIGDKMHDISTDSNDIVKSENNAIQSQHSSDVNLNRSQRNEELVMNQNQSFDNRQTASSTNANRDLVQQISGAGEEESETNELSEKDWHSTACFLDVIFCIAFILAFGIFYWAILGQLFAKNHNNEGPSPH